MRISIVIILFMLAGTISSCKKDETDPVNPMINLLSPSPSETYSVGDSILVHITASDNEQVKRVSTRITGSDGRHYTTGPGFEGNKESVELKDVIYLHDEKTVSGVYTFTATVSDGVNQAFSAVELNIQSAPLKTKSYFVSIAGPGTRVYSVSPDFSSQDLFKQYSGGTSGLFVNSYFDVLIRAGDLNAPAEAIDLLSGEVIYSAGPAGTTPRITDVFSQEQAFYHAFGSGELNRFSNNNFSELLTVSQPGYVPVQLAATENYLVSAQRPAGTGNDLIVTNFLPGGGTAFTVPVSMEVSELIYPGTGNDVYILGNRAGEGQLFLLEAANDNLRALQALPPGKFRTACRGAENTIIMGLDQGIYKYFIANGSLIPVVPGVQADHVTFDPVNELILVAEGNILRRFTQTGLSVSSLTFPSTISGLAPWFNR